MKIYIPNQSKQTLGGGFIFIDNLKKGAKAEFVSDWQSADLILIVSATMTERAEIRAAKDAKKKIIFRIDNMPKDSRNRGTAFSRMKDYGQMADVLVFQSKWALDYVGSWLENTHSITTKKHVIYNGVDTDFFYFNDNPVKRGEKYLFTTFNTDENKRFPEAAYDFHLRTRQARKDNKSLPHLSLVGNFSSNLPEYKFDFFNGEQYSYSPPLADRKKMGDAYRSSRYLYFPAFADASPNTVGEAVSCGCEVLLANPIGGTIEVIEQYKNKIISIQEMAEQYLSLV